MASAYSRGFVPIKRFAPPTEYAVRAIELEIARGDLVERREVGQGGRCLIDLEGFGRWVVQRHAARRPR